MRVIVKTTNFVLTEAIGVYLDKRLEPIRRILKRFEGKDKGFSERPVIRIELGKISKHHRKGQVFKAEANINLPPGYGFLRAEAKAFDLDTAIDKMRDELISEIRLRKIIKQKTLKKGGLKAKKMMREG